MQQIIYRTAIQNTAARTATATSRRTGLTQWIAQKWDLAGVLALMASSAAYGVFALSHLA